MKFVFFFYSIENVSKVVIWNFDHVNLIYNNAIEMNFNDFLREGEVGEQA